MDLSIVGTIVTALMTPQGLSALLIGLFITKRIVPYWQYEEALDRLKRYEEQTPVLLLEFNKLKDIVEKDVKQCELAEIHSASAKRKQFVQHSSDS